MSDREPSNADRGGKDLGLLSDLRLPDRDLEERLLADLIHLMDHPKPLRVESGRTLFEEGDPLDSIFFLKTGRVLLSRKSGKRDLICHSHSAGKILGVLALAGGGKAFFTCRAASEVEVVPLECAKLLEALNASPGVALRFVEVLVRILTKRNRRGVELQVELERTQRRLIEAEKMATLGELSAGVAHELNNPISAIGRDSSYLYEDVVSLAEESPHREEILAAIDDAYREEPLSTKSARAMRREMETALGDPALARRLVDVGIRTEEEYRGFLSRLSADPEEGLRIREKYYSLGRSLRNLSHCSNRVSSIVRSLKSYAQGGENRVPDYRVEQGLEDTLLMCGNRLLNVEVIRTYGDTPPIEGSPGQLNQVWTNLISNALEAMGGEGTLTLETKSIGEDRVEVRIVDNGPGVPERDRERLFNPNFTTKRGGADFGLGMGLGICRNIVEGHRGTIRFDEVSEGARVRVGFPVGPVSTEEKE